MVFQVVAVHLVRDLYYFRDSEELVGLLYRQFYNNASSDAEIKHQKYSSRVYFIHPDSP